MCVVSRNRCGLLPLRSAIILRKDRALSKWCFLLACARQNKTVWCPNAIDGTQKSPFLEHFDEHNTVGQSQKTANTRGQQPSANLVALAIRSRVPLESPAVKIAWTWAHSKAVALWTSEQCEARTAGTPTRNCQASRVNTKS